MERGWYATGLLEPLWGDVGGRDGLAKATRIQPATISGYNTGRLRLGLTNGRKIADVLSVSVLELGAPADLSDQRGHELLARLESIATALGTLAAGQREILRRLPHAEADTAPRARPRRKG